MHFQEMVWEGVDKEEGGGGLLRLRIGSSGGFV